MDHKFEHKVVEYIGSTYSVLKRIVTVFGLINANEYLLESFKKRHSLSAGIHSKLTNVCRVNSTTAEKEKCANAWIKSAKKLMEAK